jgi:ABC-type glycerol-3-phosphate transport system substrate-binding protein
MTKRQTFLSYVMPGLIAMMVLVMAIGTERGTAPAIDEIVSGEINTAESSILAMSVNAQATATPNAVAGDRLVVWISAPMMPVAGSDTETALNGYMADFGAANNMTIELRARKEAGIGGIYETVYNARSVAPSAMPDVVLVHSSQLSKMAAESLLLALDDQMQFDDLFETGQVLAGRFGIPYALNVRHSMYRTDALQAAPRTIDDLGQAWFIFSLRQGGTLHPVVLAQYLSVGGQITDAAGQPTLTRAALEIALANYARYAAAGINLETAVIEDYVPALISGRLAAVLVDSDAYLALGKGPLANTDQMQQVGVSVVPVLSNASNLPVDVDGWFWAVTATQPERQSQALLFISWMMDSTRMSSLLARLNRLPARRSALALWGGPHQSYFQFAATLLDSPLLPQQLPPAFVTAVQQALADVLDGRKTAARAAEDAEKAFNTAIDKP